MYAVVKTGGKQACVEKGGTEVVEKLTAKVGDTVTLEPLFVSDNGKTLVTAAELATVTVTAEVVEHFKGEKVVVFKFKKRKGYKRTKGHRQQLTRILVTDIAVGGAKPKKTAPEAAERPVAKKAPTKAPAKPKAAPKPASKPAPMPAAEKTAAAAVAEKPVAKPKAASKSALKTSAPKPAAKTARAAKAETAEKPTAKKAPAARKPAARKPAPKKPAE